MMIKKIIFSAAFFGIINFSFAQTKADSIKAAAMAQQKSDSISMMSSPDSLSSLDSKAIQEKANSIKAAAMAQHEYDSINAAHPATVQMTSDTAIPTPNTTAKPEIYKATYRGIFIGFGLVAGKSDSVGDAVNYGKSTDFSIGYRFKTDLCSFDAIGYDLDYRITSFNLKQDSAKILPNKIQHKSEEMNFNNFELALYNRFQIGNSAHSFGRYLDIGIYGDWTFSVVHKTVDTYSVANAAGASTTDTKDKGLIFVNPFNYGVLARIGFNKWQIYGNYRLSNQFKKAYIFPELPKLTIGVQRDLFGMRKQKKVR